MIPIYRAKKIDRDEYIEGYFLFQEKSRECIEICQIYNTKIRATYEVDKTTLSIHFPDMVDSNGNKIFASLQEDGKGGDICQTTDYLNGTLSGVAIYDNFSFRIHRIGKAMGISFTSKDIKIIGIQE